MKKAYLFILSCYLFISPAFSQEPPRPAIRLKNGHFTGQKNLLREKPLPEHGNPLIFRQKQYALLQFDRLPGAAEKEALSALGIRLSGYLPGNAFLAEMPVGLLLTNLKKHDVSGVYQLTAPFKIARNLQSYLDQPVTDPSRIIAVTFFGSLEKTAVAEVLRQSGATIVPTKIRPPQVIFLHASPGVLKKIAALPFVSYLSGQVMKDSPLNYNNRAAHAVDALSAASGRDLQGKGVAIGIGDNGDPSTHIDFAGRLINRNPAPAAGHGTHTTGTVGGAGILDPRYKGMAPESTLISQFYSDILVNAPVYLNDFDMVLTTNSYTDAIDGCAGEGEYDVLSSYVDDQLSHYPSLLHVFAAGNDGQLSCTPYPAAYATIKSGFQCAKDVLSVGNLDNQTYLINPASSLGPVNDGRLKPEIVAGGTNIISTWPGNSYRSESGTSMSSPTAAGTITLLYEGYRKAHGGADPSGALIKAAVCNSADDLGNPGPDYVYGFGMLNARTAMETIENNRYFTGSLNNGGTATHTITGIAAGGYQLKVLLYWNDPAAAPNAATALVNNLDLTVTTPDATVHYPLILDPSPGNVTANATEGVDNINNIEQVVIDNPPPGDFTVTVKGTNLPEGPQDYVVVYELITPSVTLEYPYGNETWVPGQIETIRWSADGADSNPFTIDYSLNNGSSWTTISSSVPASRRSYPWTVPDSATNQALIRLTRNGAGYTSQSAYDFTILGQPVVTATKACRGYAQLVWDSIPPATEYHIMMLKGSSMQTVATTTDTAYLLGGLTPDSTYWLAVAAVNGSTPGRRSLARSIIPNSGSCTLAAFDNDLAADQLGAPLTGRMYTSSQLGNSAVRLWVRNLDNAASTGSFTVSYQVNGGAVVTETSSQVIAAASRYLYTFATPYDFSAPGTYLVKTWVAHTGDAQPANDTLTTLVRNLANDPLVLNPDFTEGFEGALAQSYTRATLGLDSLDRCDFRSNTTNGRARTFINSGFARTGDRCITLDQVKYSNSPNADSLIMTFNLSNYSAADQLWLNLYYKNHGVDFSLPGNQVWIRGNDQAPWLPVFTLPADVLDIGSYKAAPNIPISEILAAATPAQTISSSFQVKLGEQGFTSANSVLPDGDVDDGYSFDDISISRAVNDIAVTALVNPALPAVCNLSNAEQIQVKVRNYSSTDLNNISVSYQLNGNLVTETIPSLPANQTTIYTFSQTADLSAYQAYTLNTWVYYSGDTYHRNDSLLDIRFQTTPTITHYPYLEGFESNNGYWYTKGINDSWEWGSPANTIIHKAANGDKAWVTGLSGTYNNSELSYLYSPCFDLSGLTQPVLSFSHIFQTEDDCDCDYHWVEYSTDDLNWTKLGSADSGVNWYDNTLRTAWQASDTNWHVSSFDIPVHPSKLRFRFVMYSDPGVNYEGVGIDDVHVFDKAAIDTATGASSLSQNVSGSGWTDFDIGGRRLVSINANGQDLGLTRVTAYVDTGAVRYAARQYYLGRNIVVQPATPPTGKVSVRYYFTDAEAQALVHATGCSSCYPIADPYMAGVTQYSGAPAEEDSSLANNLNGTTQFMLPQSDLQVIPYDNGYYAEYQVSRFSEFWINGGGSGLDRALPMLLENFTATKVDSSALLQWNTGFEDHTDSFIIEKSTDSSRFSPIGEVKATGGINTPQSYQFTDNALAKGANYYRLKVVDSAGHFGYSPVRLIDGGSALIIGIYPNPVTKGWVHVNTSADAQRISLYDLLGRRVRSKAVSGNSNTLNVAGLPFGTYFLSVVTATGKKVVKISLRE